MNKNIAISIIIPVHNSEKYLESALKSVVLQEFDKPFEVLVINNDSVDSSGDIIQKYTDLYKNVIHITTKGLTANEARMVGIKHSVGDYICFLDSDDFYRLDFLQIMHDKIIETKADVVNCSYARYLENNKIHKSVFAISKTFSREKGLNYLLFDLFLRGYMPMKIYRRDLLMNIKLPISKHLTVFEDYLFNFVVYLNATKTVSIRDALYFYRLSSSSITRESSSLRPISKVNCFAAVRYLIEQDGNEKLLKTFFLYKNRLWLSIKYDVRLGTKNEPEKYKTRKEEIRKLYKIITNKDCLQIDGQPWELLINDIK